MASKRPSSRVTELIRQAAQITVNARPEWLEELDDAVLGANPAIAVDPELASAVSRSNLANLLFWATANVRDPGAPVPPNVGPEPLNVARKSSADISASQSSAGFTRPSRGKNSGALVAGALRFHGQTS